LKHRDIKVIFTFIWRRLWLDCWFVMNERKLWI